MMANDAPQQPRSFSFAGAGWLQMYYFGVAHALQEYGVHRNARFAGASAGSLVSTGLVLDCNFLDIRDQALACSDDCYKSLFNAFRLQKYIINVIDNQLGEQRFKERKQELEKRIEIAVTVLPGCHGIRYKSFKNYEHFKQILIASCCATPIAGLPFQLDGKWVIDGAVADFQPLIDLDSITVAPFYFHRAHIKPSQYVPVWWSAYPGTRVEFERLFQLGYEDSRNWLDTEGYRIPIDGYTPPARYCTPFRETEQNSTPQHIYTTKDLPHARPRRYSVSVEEEHKLSKVLRLKPDTFHNMMLHVDHKPVLPSTPTPSSRNSRSTTTRKPMYRHIQEPKSRGITSTAKELLLLLFVFAFVKPVSYGLLYTELVVMSIIALVRALLHDLLPTFSRRTRMGAWLRFIAYIRSL
eukprot:Ihof_evm2s616 gene=Ihof_evmTU2s616